MENTQDYQDYQDYRAEILGIVRLSLIHISEPTRH